MRSDPSTWHRISNADSLIKTGTCLQCGPGVSVRFKVKKAHRDGGYWVCIAGTIATWHRTTRKPHGLTSDQARKFREGRMCEVPSCAKSAEVVDHCHTDLRIRGVLCSDHNAALGLCHDSIEELEGLIEYLKMTQGVDGLARLGYAG